MSYPSDLHEDDVLAGKDHELTLSTAAIFGIFFGLVALCAVFFGFGYSLGSHKSPTLLPAESPTSASGANFSGFKPAAGQPASAGSAHTSAAPVVPVPAAQQTNEDTTKNEETTPAPLVRTPPATAPHPAVTQPTPPPAAAPPAAAGLFVQVAAISVSHPDDATLMVNALRAKGYAASSHTAGDNFLHVLIGPIPTRPAAEAMLKRLSADGYTAYIK
jgi:cell division septation protein DedD